MIRNTVFAILLVFNFSLFASNSQHPASIFDEMNYKEVLEIELEISMDNLLSNRRAENDYGAKLNFTDKKGKLQSWNTKVSLRGKFRRMKCAEMPPLKLKFKKNDLSAAGLSTSNDLKMVTQCVEDEKEAKELLLKEYIAYKLYNEITDYSFRVQLVKVSYKDAVSGNIKNQWAFLIEDTAQMRERLAAEKLGKREKLNLESINTEIEKTAAIFQYLIGNHDWGIPNRKNVKIIKKGTEYYSIPYDFDFSGIVCAPYAKANTNLGITTRHDRVYLGLDQNLDNLAETLEVFKSKKSALIKTIKNFKELNFAARKDMISYVKSFYENANAINTKDKFLAIRGSN